MLHISIEPDVVLNSLIIETLAKLDPFFGQAGLRGVVTSGVRTPQKQLSIILEQAVKDGIPVDGIRPEDWNKKEGLYVWQSAWSLLLHRGFIANPPLPAVCLEDYVNSRGEQMRGKTIGSSPHQRGTAFDLAGLTSIPALDLAIKGGVQISYLAERGENKATHVDILG